MRWLLIISMTIFFIACGGDSSNKESIPLKAVFVNQATSLAQNAQIVIEFSNDIDPQSITSTSFVVYDAKGKNIDGVRSVSGKILSFSIAGVFPLNETFSATLTTDIKDITGASLSQEVIKTFVITSSDVEAPRILGSSVENGRSLIQANLSVQMNEDINPNSITKSTLELYDSTNALVSGTVSYAQGLIKFTPIINLSLEVVYKLVLSTGIKDMSGNALTAEQEYLFTVMTNVNEGKFVKALNSINLNMGINGALVDESTTYIASSENSVGIYSLLDAPNLVELSKTSLNSKAIDIQKSGNHLFVTTESSGLVVIDVSDPSSAKIVASLDSNSSIFKTQLVGTNLYMASTSNGVQIVDISNPLTPNLLNTIKTSDSAFDVLFLSTEVSYVSDKRAGLSLIDTSLQNSGLIKSILTGAVTRDLLINDNFLYVANSILGVEVYDISNPLNPLHINTLPTLSYAFDLHYASDGVNDYLYVADKEKGVRIFDVSDTTNITSVAQLFSNARVFTLSEYNSMLLTFEDTGIISFYNLFPDLVAPTILRTKPSTGENDVAVDTEVSIVFSEDVVFTDINSTTSIMDASSNSISVTSSYDVQSHTLLLKPDQNLTEASTYTVYLSGEVKDRVGNSMQNIPYSFSFSTIVVDHISPTILRTEPSAGKTDVAIDSEIAIVFSEDVVFTDINGTTSIMDASSNSISITSSYDVQSHTLFLRPDQNLTEASTYTVYLSGEVKDSSGNLMQNIPYSFSFSTVVIDNIAPKIISSSPVNRSSVSSASFVVVGFSEEMNVSTMTSANVELKDNTDRVYSGTTTYQNTALTFQPDITLFKGRTYTFTVSGLVSDLTGNVLGVDQAIIFDILPSANAAPTVSSTTPSQDATVFSNYGNITINFSEAMDAASFVSGSTVTSPNGISSITVVSPTQIDVVVGFSTPPETIQLTITNGVKDATGVNMTSSYTLTYTTSSGV